MARLSFLRTLVASSFVLLGGCGGLAAPCDSFPSAYERLNTDLNALAHVPSSAAPASALQAIDQCYQRHPYAGQSDPITFQSARASGGGKTFLIYGIEGVSDVSLVFETDEAGSISRAFQYSWFYSGAPRSSG